MILPIAYQKTSNHARKNKKVCIKVLTQHRCIAIMNKKPQKKNKGDTQDANCCFWQNGIYGYDDEHGHDDVHVFCDVHIYFVIVLRIFLFM